ncbi:hypothetical protein ACL1EU_03070 [Corynebacterium striatum]
MPVVSGSLLFVTSRPSAVSEVWVRARDVRTSAQGVVVESNDRIPVVGGAVSFEVLPGPAVLTLVEAGRPVETIPILVGDAGTQSLQQVVSAAKVADDATRREIEKLAAQAVELVDSSVENAKKAQDGATRAETAAGNAQRSEASSASSASGAKSSASAAASSASKAATSEQAAARSASAAATSASSAKSNADRAANIASSTSWNGDKLTVNGKTSPSLTGPQGPPGEVTKSQLDTALAGKAAQADMVALQQQLAALTAPVTVFQGSHTMSNGTLQVQTPRMYGTVTITVDQSGPDNQAGLVQPRIYSHDGTRYTESMGGWLKTTGGAGTAYKYLTDVENGQTLTLDPGYYIDGIEIYSRQTGATTITKITVQN